MITGVARPVVAQPLTQRWMHATARPSESSQLRTFFEMAPNPLAATGLGNQRGVANRVSLSDAISCEPTVQLDQREILGPSATAPDAASQWLMRVNSKSLDRLGRTREFTLNIKNSGIERR